MKILSRLFAAILLLSACNPSQTNPGTTSLATSTIQKPATIEIKSIPVTVPATQQSAQTAQNLPTIKSGQLSNLVMIDAEQGWGIFTDEKQVDRIIKTSDGGRSWRTVSPSLPPQASTPAPRSLTTFFLDAQRAWAAVRTYDPQDPLLPFSSVWRTQDGGQSWQVSQVIETERLAEYNDPLLLYFLDGQQGWLLTGHGAAAGSAPVSLYQTQDGGQTWQLRLEMLSPESGSVNTCCTSGMVFLDSNTGLITKSAGPDPIGQVNWSKDGGGTWFRQDIPVPAEYSNPAYCGTASPGVVSPDLTYFLGECLPADDPNGDLIDLLYTTHDLGATWDITILPASPEPSPPLALDYQSKQIHFVDGQTGWFVISNIYAGEAGAAKSGQTLIYSLPQVDSASIPLGQFDWAGQVYFLDQKLGWATIASDAPGGLAFTQDGGLTWEFISPTLID